MNTAIPSKISDFLPRTLDERLAKLRERLMQAWPTFSRYGDHEYARLWLHDHDQGTLVRFYRSMSPITFDSVGAVRHGAYWHLSEALDGVTKLGDAQMREYLAINKLNWVIIL